MVKKNQPSVVATLTPQLIQAEFTVTDLAKNTKSVGDALHETFHNTGDFKAAAGAVAAYGVTVSAMKALLIYKKLTGTPMEIEFFKH